MKIVWNGGFEMGWKEIGTMVWLLWMAAAGWYKLQTIESHIEALETSIGQHNAWAYHRSEDLTVLGARMEVMEQRIDPCCPLFRGNSR